MLYNTHMYIKPIIMLSGGELGIILLVRFHNYGNQYICSDPHIVVVEYELVVLTPVGSISSAEV